MVARPNEVRMLKVSSAAAVAVCGGLWFFSTTQSEKPVVAPARASAMEDLEKRAAADPGAAAELMKRYVEARTPGMAERHYKTAPERVKADLVVRHAFARALAEQGRARDALGIQEDVLSTCEQNSKEHPECGQWLISASKRRLEVFRELVKLGVDDAVANPEKAEPAYERVLSTLASAER